MTAIFRPGSSIRHDVGLGSFFPFHRQAVRTPGDSMADSTLSKHLMIPLKLDVSNENSHEVRHCRKKLTPWGMLVRTEALSYFQLDKFQ